MTVIASFSTFNFDKSELTGIAGEIQYPYIKFPRLRNYTTLQIAAKTRETITIKAIFTDSTRFSALSTLAAIRSKATLMLGNKDWGQFVIERLRRRIDSRDVMVVDIEFNQTSQVMSVGNYISSPNSVGSFGLFELGPSELLDELSEELTYPTIELARFQNFPKIQNGGDDLKEIDLKLRFSSLYNTNPQERLDSLRVLADTYSFYQLIILGRNYGNYVVQSLRWTASPIIDILEVSVGLLQSPTGIPPRQPVIFSFVVNSVQKVTTLAPALTSLTYQDPITGGTSILELEFDAQATGLPVEGDAIEIVWGYSDAPTNQRLNSGTHKCDRPVRRYSPDIVTIGTQSYDYGLSLNSQQPITYLNQQLNNIISNIATHFSITLTSNATTIIAGTTTTTTGNVTVAGDSYFKILTDLARDYGYRMQFKFGNLYFQSYSSLAANPTAFTLTPTDCLSAEFITKIRGLYSQCIIPYKGTNTAGTVVDTNIPNNDILDFRTGNIFWQDLAAALARSSGELKHYNKERHVGTIVIEGRYNAISGNNLQLTSFDNSNDNAKFQIEKATHRLSATGGWLCELEIRKVFV